MTIELATSAPESGHFNYHFPETACAKAVPTPPTPLEAGSGSILKVGLLNLYQARAGLVTLLTDVRQ